MEKAPQCEQLKQEYQDLKTLKGEFDLAYERAIKTGDLTRAKELKTELEQRMAVLKNKLWPLEGLPQQELSEQYQSQKEIMKNAGLLERLSNGELGIKGIDNKEYPIPTPEAIAELLRQNPEKYQAKIEQGFNQILMVPLAMPLDRQIEILKQNLLKHHQQGKLLATKENPTDIDEPLDLNTINPVWVWDNWPGSDVSKKTVYFPKSFDKNNHQGKTKQELLNRQNNNQSPIPGWQVLLLENNPNIPAAGQGQTIGGRLQLEANKTPDEYLKLLQENPDYANEQGLTIEAWLTLFISHLEQTNQVIDDYNGKGKICYLTGSFNPSSADLVRGNWNRSSRQARLYGSGPGNRDGSFGLRSAVGVEN